MFNNFLNGTRYVTGFHRLHIKVGTVEVRQDIYSALSYVSSQLLVMSSRVVN